MQARMSIKISQAYYWIIIIDLLLLLLCKWYFNVVVGKGGANFTSYTVGYVNLLECMYVFYKIII